MRSNASRSMWLSILRDALRAPQDEDVKFRSRDAICIRVIFKRHESFASNGREAVLQAPLVRREAERREAHHPRPCSFESTATCSAEHASPFGAPPRRSPGQTHPASAQPQFPRFLKDRRHRALPFASCLQQPRSAETGRSAGRAVTPSRPGAICETARGDRTCSTF